MIGTSVENNDDERKFVDFLKSRRLRKTPERFEILRCILAHNGHFDVDNLYTELDKTGYHVSRATIYNTIELLCTSGIVRRLLFDTHQARYEKVGRIHSHLVCTECGEIREVDLEGIDNVLTTMRFHGFKSAYVSTCIYGVCEKCSKKLNTRQPE